MAPLSQTPVSIETPLITEEKIRGALSSAATGVVTTTMNIFGVTVLGLSAPMSLLIMYYILGGIVAYILDVLFAKYKFHGVHIPYTHLGPRFMWMLSSLLDRFLLRFVVTIIIEALTAVAMLDTLIMVFDKYKVWDHGRAKTIRNLGLAVGVAAIIYILFGNVLRYDWAFNETEQPMFNMVVMMWVALTILVYCRGSNTHENNAMNTPVGGLF